MVVTQTQLERSGKLTINSTLTMRHTSRIQTIQKCYQCASTVMKEEANGGPRPLWFPSRVCWGWQANQKLVWPANLSLCLINMNMDGRGTRYVRSWYAIWKDTHSCNTSHFSFFLELGGRYTRPWLSECYSGLLLISMIFSTMALKQAMVPGGMWLQWAAKGTWSGSQKYVASPGLLKTNPGKMISLTAIGAWQEAQACQART